MRPENWHLDIDEQTLYEMFKAEAEAEQAGEAKVGQRETEVVVKNAVQRH